MATVFKFGVCATVRLGIAAGAYFTPPHLTPLWAIPAGITALRNAGRMIDYTRQQNSGSMQTGAFGQDVWWNTPGRLVHIVIMILFIILALTKNKYMWVAPALDIGYGITNYITHYSG